MVSSDTARMGILRRAKYPQSAPLIRYRDARDAVCRYLTDRTRSLNQLVSAESMLKQRSEDPAISAFWQEDAKFSIEVLRAVQRMANQLGQFRSRLAKCLILTHYRRVLSVDMLAKR